MEDGGWIDFKVDKMGIPETSSDLCILSNEEPSPGARKLH
jgi:hypothetical protein